VSEPVPTVEQLLGVLAERDRVIDELQARIVELERRLGQNSKNSSRAPSGDRLERSPSRAEQRKAGRKPGKQPGGQGFALRRTDSPDTVVDHVPAACAGCGAGLAGAAAVKVSARQVFDVPEVSATVTDHRARAQNLTQIPPDVGDPLLHRWKHALLCGLADNPPTRAQTVQDPKLADPADHPGRAGVAVRPRPARGFHQQPSGARSATRQNPTQNLRLPPLQQRRPSMATDPRLHLHHAQKRCPRPHRTPRRHHRKPLDPSRNLNGYGDGALSESERAELARLRKENSELKLDLDFRVFGSAERRGAGLSLA